jgi:hypothetical protein
VLDISREELVSNIYQNMFLQHIIFIQTVCLASNKTPCLITVVNMVEGKYIFYSIIFNLPSAWAIPY